MHRLPGLGAGINNLAGIFCGEALEFGWNCRPPGGIASTQELPRAFLRCKQVQVQTTREVMIMKKLLLVSALATAAGLVSGLVAAQEVGKVLSSTPVLKRVTEPRSTCSSDASGQQHCRTEMVTEDRQIGFKVVYEYAGTQHTVQLPFAPGATIPLEVKVSVQGAASATDSPPAYASPPPEGVERYVRGPVYVEPVPVYYPSRYYYPGYYYDPLYPVVGLALGYTVGVFSHGWRGIGHAGHWRR
jgi:uncharacterized protein YcfJ